MKLKKLQFVLFCAIFWLINQAEGQTAKCDYKYEYHWTTGYKTINASYYKCDLDTRQANYDRKLTRIDGQHGTGHSDADVKYIRNYIDHKIKTFSSIFCQKFPNLEVIDISDAELKSIDEDSLQNCKNLNHLLLFGNKIRELPENLLIKNPKLTYLWISNNQLTTIPENLFLYQNELEELYLDKNQINFLPSNIFRPLVKLEVLHLYSNDISDLPVGVFAQLKKLQILSLRNNKLTTIHSDSFGIHNQLTNVYLENNKMNAIDEKFIDNTAVSTLYMTNNICSQLLTFTRSEIKPNLKKCFDNYQPRRQPQLQVSSCGKGLKAVSTIIGGTEVKRGMSPWIAALFESSDKYFCGGTLLTNRKVVTAAHCMLFLARDITVLLGVHDLSRRNEAGRFAYAVQNINIHPEWNPETDTYDADIAVMILETEVTFSKHIQPICLMDSSSILATNTEGVVIGYGKDEDPNKNHLNIPKSINMPIHQNEDCFLKDYLFAKLSSKRTFCGGTGNGTGVCLGDSGSGLVITDGSAYYLRGIVSASLNNMTYGCDVDTYSIFTNVLKFTDWINSVSVDPIY